MYSIWDLSILNMGRIWAVSTPQKIATIGELVTNANDVLTELTDDSEIIVVNDGSSDGTSSPLRQLSFSLH